MSKLNSIHTNHNNPAQLKASMPKNNSSYNSSTKNHDCAREDIEKEILKHANELIKVIIDGELMNPCTETTNFFVLAHFLCVPSKEELNFDTDEQIGFTRNSIDHHRFYTVQTKSKIQNSEEKADEIGAGKRSFGI